VSDLEESPEPRIERLSKKISAALGTPYSVFIERDACRREWVMTAQCQTCHAQWHTSVTDGALVDDARIFDRIANGVITVAKKRRARTTLESDACLCVDGLKPSACLARYQARQRQSDDKARRRVAEYRLSQPQLVAARSAWSSSLRAKQAEAREVERCFVRCDEQWGEDV
jgi:hypothetical protein